MTFSFRALTTTVAALLAAAALTPAASPASASPSSPSRTAAAPADCTGDLKVDQTLPNGARWQLCWDIDADQGLLTKRVRYTPKGSGAIDVLQHLSLAQIHVPYDAGDDIMDMPMGEGSAVQLTAKDCPGGRLLKRRPTDTKAYACLRTLDRGLGYKQGTGDGDDGKQRQSKELVLNAVMSVGWYNYIIEYRFGDEGDITPRLGATGSLAETDDSRDYLDARKGPKYGWAVLPGYTKFAESHSHNAYWRMDFGMQGTTGNQVEQFDFTGGGTAKREMKRTVLQKETAGTLSPMRSGGCSRRGRRTPTGTRSHGSSAARWPARSTVVPPRSPTPTSTSPSGSSARSSPWSPTRHPDARRRSTGS